MVNANDPAREAFEKLWYSRPDTPLLWRKGTEFDSPYRDSGMNERWAQWKVAWDAAIASKFPEYVSIQDRITELRIIHGSFRSVAEVVRLDPGYLKCLESGTKDNPSDETLSKLGLVRYLRYTRKPGYKKLTVLSSSTVQTVI